jgi:hypothetical protein
MGKGAPLSGGNSGGVKPKMGRRDGERPSSVELLKYSECMRANGIPDFPDPTANGLALNMGGDREPPWQLPC